MLNNIYILQKIVKELEQCIGCKIIDSYSNQIGLLFFEIYDGRNSSLLNVSLIPDFEAIFLSHSINKPKRRIYRQFPLIFGEIIQNIEMQANNRLIKIELINSNLYLQMFGKSQNNAILTNKSNLILDSYKNKKELTSKHYLPTLPILLSLTEFPTNTTISKALSSSKFLFPKHFTLELLARLNLNPNSQLSEFSNEELKKIELEAQKFASEIESSSYYFYLKNEQNIKVFSPIRLTMFPSVIEEGDNLFKLIRKVFIDRLNQHRFEKLHKLLLDIDIKYLKKFESKVNRFNEIPRLKKLIEEYQKFTNLLYTLPNLKQNGLGKVNLKDFEGNEVVIPLDSKLTIIQNIEKYFSKIKKIKRDIEIIEKNHNAIIDEYKLHFQRYNQLIKIQNYYKLKEFYKEHINFYKRNMQNLPKEAGEKFRKFELTQNAILYVGKDAKNNDELTFGFGKPNDYWFHLRGGSGSHCILKYSGEGKPPKEIIEKCASIAAYYSSQRNGGYVPVIYTQRKYVRKPKGAHTGAVVVSKEEVILVEPKSYEEIK